MLHFHSRLGEKKHLATIALFMVRILIGKWFGGVFTPANFLIVGCALPHSVSKILPHLLPKHLPKMHIGLLWDVPIPQAENMKLETWDFC